MAAENVRLPDGIERPRIALAIFLLISFAFAWAYVLLYDALLADRLAGTTAGRIVPYLGAWAPLVAVVVVLRRSGVDMRTWFDHQITLREPVRYYLFALLVPNLVASAAMFVFVVEGVGLTVSVSPVNFLLVFGFTAVLLGALEEFGWRAFLHPALQARTTAVTAALLVGTVWGLWHVPSHLLGYLGDRPLPLFLLHLLPMSVVMAWLYNRCRGLLPVMVFHAAHNAPGNIFATMGQPTPGAGDLYYLVYTGIWIVVGAMVIAYSGADLGSSGRMVSRPRFTLATAEDDR